MKSTSSNASNYSLNSALPSPVSPTSLSMPTPSLGSNDILPPPKRGAPSVAPMPKKKGKKDDKKKGAALDPALCEGW